MMRVDRRALLCDLAETYHIYSFDSVPPVLLATLCAGLRPDARIHEKMDGIAPVSEHYYMALAIDLLNLIRHGLFADKNAPEPTLLTEKVFGASSASKNEYEVFDSSEHFRERWALLTGG